VDVFADGDEILVEVALPGCRRTGSSSSVPRRAGGAGRAPLPRRLASAAIQRLEIPHGHFERRLALPPGRWSLVRQELDNGCLQLLLAGADRT